MRRTISMLILGLAAGASFVTLAACEDDTTLSPAPHDAGGEAGEGGEGGNPDAAAGPGPSDAMSDADGG